LIPRGDPGGCAILSAGGVTVAGVTTIEERLRTLEVRVDSLETWAGPGQAQALAEGQRELRADLAKVQRTQDRHTRMLADLISDVSGLKTDVASLKTDVAELKTDVAELKTDVAGLKSGMTEILRRLPAPPAGA
jgi:septal ring factor EnvC (AmiA/AmiB activator)